MNGMNSMNEPTSLAPALAVENAPPATATGGSLSVKAVALVVALAALPLALPDYFVFQATMLLMYAIAVLGLNILMGYNGQISIGHSAFFAIGAYCSAICMDRFGMPFWATLPLAAVASFAFGFMMGFPALRLGGIYLALATFALAMATPQLLKYKLIEEWTGGVQGIVVLKPASPFTSPVAGIQVSDDYWFYLLTLAVAVVLFWLASNLLRGRIGRALIAIRDHPVAASAMGINLPVVKSVTFGISAAYTGVAGALSAVAVGFVSPDSFPGFLSITLLVAAVVGGLGSVQGAFFGALFILLIPNFAEQISKSAPSAIYGVLLLVVMVLMPRGVAGALKSLWARVASPAAVPSDPTLQTKE